jgi:hypothetical protein
MMRKRIRRFIAPSFSYSRFRVKSGVRCQGCAVEAVWVF